MIWGGRGVSNGLYFIRCDLERGGGGGVTSKACKKVGGLVVSWDARRGDRQAVRWAGGKVVMTVVWGGMWGQ